MSVRASMIRYGCSCFFLSWKRLFFSFMLLKLSARVRSHAAVEERERKTREHNEALYQEVERCRFIKRTLTEIHGVLSSTSGTEYSSNRELSGGSSQQYTGTEDIGDLSKIIAQELQEKKEAIGRIRGLENRVNDMSTELVG